MRRTLCCLLALVWPALVLLAAPPPIPEDATKPLVSILEKDGVKVMQPLPKPPYLDILAKRGLIVDYSAETRQDPLTWKKLKQYQVLVMTNFNEGHGRADYDPEQLGELLDRFLAEGGGILYIGTRLMSSPDEHDAMNRWLKPHGAQIRWGTVLDPEHSFDPPPFPYQRQGVFWTTNIAKHPVTEGVKTLFLRNHCFYAPYLRPLTVDDNWTVLARAMPGAQVLQCERPQKAGIARPIPDTARTEAAPLIAMRQVGKGRIALFGHDPGPFWYDLGQPAIGEICAKNGDGERKPDWLPLLRNLCVWLSEPARESGSPGGRMERVELTFRRDWGTRDPIDWEKPDIAWSDEDFTRLFGVHSPIWPVEAWRDQAAGEYQALPILVGARTQLSGGQGTVADWKQAALAAGYKGIAFREELFDLTEAQWTAFEAECRAATDDTFVALPGQQFHEREGNRFLRFNFTIPWHGPGRLTPDGSTVLNQLHFFFDAGHAPGYGLPANFPLVVQGNPTPWWSYRVYDALPIAVYDAANKRIEDNLEYWKQLVDRIEFTSPMAVHLLDDPAQVAATKDDFRLHLLAPSVRHLRTDPMWRKRAVGIGNPNNAASFVSNGPIIEAFLPVGMNRTTLGVRGIDGTYRWRLLVRARSDEPIELVEVWGGRDCLRRYRPNAKQFHHVIDELHDCQRGIWLRVVDAKGREAFTTSTNSHDKMLYLQWCGDHCNHLGGGMGVDEDGDPAGFGVASHVRLKLSGGAGPGASSGAARSYIPYGTDTGSPSLGIFAQLQLHTADGTLPAPHENVTPELLLYHNNRTIRITHQQIETFADRRQYLGKDAPKPYDSGYISAWGAYVKHEPLTAFTALHEDIDFHRDAGEPAFQWVRGKITVNEATIPKQKNPFNFDLGRSNWLQEQTGWRFNGRELKDGESVNQALGTGGHFSFPNIIGHGTIFALDDRFAIRAALTREKSCAFFYGSQVGTDPLEPGDTVDYQYLLMRWPVGEPLDSGFDAKVAKLLFGPERLRLTARHGTVGNAGFGFRVAAADHRFEGTLPDCEIPIGLPLQVTGLARNWAAGLWWEGKEHFEPLAPAPDGVLWAQLKPKRHHGAFFIGNVLTCDDERVILRLLQTRDGWEVLAHNPTAEPLRLTVRGTPGGPMAGFARPMTLPPGAELRHPVR